MKKLVAANWKMYKKRFEAKETMTVLLNNLSSLAFEHEVVVFAPFTSLTVCAEIILGSQDIFLGAQDVYPAQEGAFTGEISPGMLLDCLCRFVLTGHSERRHVLGESNGFIGKKTSFALESGLDVILCVGEKLDEREKGQLVAIIEEQLKTGLTDVKDDIAPERISIAYEPVWAIGTGKVAGPTEIQEAHALVRTLLIKRFPTQGHEIRILYGGSVKPDNASQIMGLDNVDGVLVGGASLQAENFAHIVRA